MAEEFNGETILIKIGEDDVEYETELSFTEVIFWLETLKVMMLQKVINPE